MHRVSNSVQSFLISCMLIFQALSILQQVIAGLAVAEEVYQFEHRDLHWGNILVESTPDVKFISFNLAGVTKEINCVGVTAKIIDFTFSRMTQGNHNLIGLS